MKTRSLIVLTIILLATVPAYATDYNVSGEASCLALPVATSWTSALSFCTLDADFTIGAADSLTLSSGVALVLPTGRTLDNAGTLTIFARLLQQGGTLNNLAGGLIEAKSFWDARDSADINNFSTATIVLTNQLHVTAATLLNFGLIQITSGTLSISGASSLINSNSIINDANITVRGLFENNATVINNDVITIACDGDFQNNGTLTGNPFEFIYCINGGDWSDLGAWSTGTVPPTDARIEVRSSGARMDIDVTLSGSLLNFGPLVIESGVDFEILADGSVKNQNEFITHARIINNHSIVNHGSFINEGIIVNNADFGNLGTMDANGRIENYGGFANAAGTFMQNGIDNRAGGIMDNHGTWKVNRSNNDNRGEFKNHPGAVLELNNKLFNKSGGFIENLGVITVNDSLTFPGRLENNSGGLIVNSAGAELNLTAAAVVMENAGETRNSGTIGNDGTLNNPGRICGPGAITGNAVLGNVPVAVCNRAPTADARPDGANLECTSTTTTNVSVDGRSSSDPDLRDELTFSWVPSTGLGDASAALTSGDFGLGNHIFTLTVTDLEGASDSDGASFTVEDTTQPSLTCPATVTAVADDMCVGTANPPLAVATDICDTDPDVTRSPSGNFWLLGLNQVTHTARDASGNIRSCNAIVEVVDETIPVLQCNTTGAFVRPGQPISFQATATDNCSVAAVSVTSYDCWKFDKKGNRIDKTDACVISIAGDTINITDAGGVGTIIGWTTEAADGSGNTIAGSCEVVSTNPGR